MQAKYIVLLTKNCFRSLFFVKIVTMFKLLVILFISVFSFYHEVTVFWNMTFVFSRKNLILKLYVFELTYNSFQKKWGHSKQWYRIPIELNLKWRWFPLIDRTTNVDETNYLNGEPRIVFCLALSDRRADFPFRPLNETSKMRLDDTSSN